MLHQAQNRKGERERHREKGLNSKLGPIQKTSKGLTGTPLLCNTYISEWQDFSSNPFHILATPPKVFCAVQLFYPWPGEPKKGKVENKKRKDIPFFTRPQIHKSFLAIE